MSISGLHMTQIGRDEFLLEPSRGLNVRDFDKIVDAIVERLLSARASHLFYDLSAQAIIDPVYYDWLDKLARTVMTINVKMVCVHMQPTAAFSLVQFVHGVPAFDTASEISDWQRVSL